MKKLSIYLVCVCAAICALLLANANIAVTSELVYTPINPSFGGNPYNGPWLLDSAQVQNMFEEEVNLLKEFKEMLQRQWGGDNTATIRITGDGNTALQWQNGGRTSTITMKGHGKCLVVWQAK